MPAERKAPRRSVLVTGAGFTRAFVPNSPLMVDDFGTEELAEKVNGLQRASTLLDRERNRNVHGFINIERLMTRLDSMMPYDADQGATEEYRFLHSQLLDNFLKRLWDARSESEPRLSSELSKVATYCTKNNVDCITFNYDDVLDQALAEITKGEEFPWHADGGYGFYCQDSIGTIRRHWDAQIGEKTPMLVLKLHGSINWRPRRGSYEPHMLDAITHHEEWSKAELLEPRLWSLMERHLEPRPLIAPPVLSKSSLVSQPVLRLVWSLAYEKLLKAQSVTFVGYSFPTTDMAAQTLFSEALRDIQPSSIRVVNFASDDGDKNRIVGRYREILGRIPDAQFDFSGALEWSRTLEVQ